MVGAELFESSEKGDKMVKLKIDLERGERRSGGRSPTTRRAFTTTPRPMSWTGRSRAPQLAVTALRPSTSSKQHTFTSEALSSEGRDEHHAPHKSSRRLTSLFDQYRGVTLAGTTAWSSADHHHLMSMAGEDPAPAVANCGDPMGELGTPPAPRPCERSPQLHRRPTPAGRNGFLVVNRASAAVSLSLHDTCAWLRPNIAPRAWRAFALHPSAQNATCLATARILISEERRC